jgi:hypothetical protein
MGTPQPRSYEPGPVGWRVAHATSSRAQREPDWAIAAAIDFWSASVTPCHIAVYCTPEASRAVRVVVGRVFGTGVVVDGVVVVVGAGFAVVVAVRERYLRALSEMGRADVGAAPRARRRQHDRVAASQVMAFMGVFR